MSASRWSGLQEAYAYALLPSIAGVTDGSKAGARAGSCAIFPNELEVVLAVGGMRAAGFSKASATRRKAVVPG